METTGCLFELEFRFVCTVSWMSKLRLNGAHALIYISVPFFLSVTLAACSEFLKLQPEGLLFLKPCTLLFRWLFFFFKKFETCFLPRGGLLFCTVLSRLVSVVLFSKLADMSLFRFLIKPGQSWYVVFVFFYYYYYLIALAVNKGGEFVLTVVTP